MTDAVQELPDPAQGVWKPICNSEPKRKLKKPLNFVAFKYSLETSLKRRKKKMKPESSGMTGILDL